MDINSKQSNLCIQDIVDLLNAELILPKAIVSKKPECINDFLNKSVVGIDSISGATNSQISFVAQKKYLPELSTTNALAVIISSDILDDCPVPAIVVKDAYLGFAKVSSLFAYQKKQIGIHKTAQIHPTAVIGKGVTIAENVVIGENSQIGDNSTIYANSVIDESVSIGHSCVVKNNVSIAHHVTIGNFVEIHSNATIGEEGFGFAPNMENKAFSWQKISQLGSVVIGNRVRIGSNSCVDRGALGDTIIEDGVIIDNLVQIGHNVKIGENTAIAACTGISGSTTIGKNCIIAGGVGIAGHLTIADNVTFTGMAMVTGSVNKSGSYSSGTGFMPTGEWRRAAVGFKKLAKSPIKTLINEINDLKTRLNHVESRTDHL